MICRRLQLPIQMPPLDKRRRQPAGLKARLHGRCPAIPSNGGCKPPNSATLPISHPAELTRSLKALSAVLRRAARRPAHWSSAVWRRQTRRVRAVLRAAPFPHRPRDCQAVDRRGRRGDRSTAATSSILGCGTGAAGAAWATGDVGTSQPGYDVNPWAVEEAAWTYRALGLNGHARRSLIDHVRWPSQPSDLIVAFLVNELPVPARDSLLRRLLEAARSRASGGDRRADRATCGSVVPYLAGSIRGAAADTPLTGAFERRCRRSCSGWIAQRASTIAS